MISLSDVDTKEKIGWYMCLVGITRHQIKLIIKTRTRGSFPFKKKLN